MRSVARSLVSLLAVASPVAGQSLAAGSSVGWVKLSDTRSEDAFSGILEYQTGRLSLYAIPTVLHVSQDSSGQTSTRTGLGDLPVIAAASYTSPVPGSPTIGGALLVVVPTGDAACGLGTGQTAAGLDVGAGLSPGRAHLSADASRSISGAAAQSSLSAPKATTLRVEAGYDVAPRWTWAASLGVDVGTADSTQPLSRQLGLGVSHTLAGRLMLTVDGSHGLTSASPQWVFSVGLGTAYGGASPVTPTSPLRRLRTTLGAGGSAGSRRAVGCR